MKKLICSLLVVATLSAAAVTTASAADDEILKVGLRYGGSAMFSANLENAEGAGYQFGWYDDNRSFHALGETDETTITMIAAGDIYMNDSNEYTSRPSGVYRVLGGYHAELDGYRDYDSAAKEASQWRDAWPAYVDGEYVVRVGSYMDQWEAEGRAAEIGGTVAESQDTGVMVTVTRTEQILFEYDDPSGYPLGVQPQERHGEPITWFKGYRYRGGFEYPRTRGSNLGVINVVGLEDYVKGVVPHEMSGSWPLEALKAQAVCARTFAKGCVKHLRGDGFDVCNSQHCQVYYGVTNSTDRSDQAVEGTAGMCLYYGGKLVPDAVYHSSNGGATEDGEIIWGGKSPYLKGKLDPYEAMTDIPNYRWTVTYSASELSWILKQKGYSIGRVQNVYVTRRTPNGNVQEVVFEGSQDTLRITGERCRTIFYSSTYNKSVKSQRYEINGGTGGGPGVYINDTGTPVKDLTGVAVLNGSGKLQSLNTNSASVITSSGVTEVSGGQTGPSSVQSGDGFTITGTGNGHNVGMSQYGAKAMAEQNYNYRDILEFYYTDITIE